MRYESIADIYSANEKIREGLLATVANVTDAESAALPDGEKWTPSQLVEHIAIVEKNITRLCARLTGAAKSEGKLADGNIGVSNETMAKWAASADAKLEAPDRVQPTGDVSIAVSIEQLSGNVDALAALRPDFETYDMTAHKFPHPYFGDLTATEWLVLIGGHERRHTIQLQKLLEKIRA
ncbi:MAG: DinB family protein [Pyrinomonadaceae bacterium]